MTTLPEGLLWFDNDKKRDWRQKVRDAVEAYKAKFWISPDVCYINPNTIEQDKIRLYDHYVETVDGIIVIGRHDVLPGHFFVVSRQRQRVLKKQHKPPVEEYKQERLL